MRAAAVGPDPSSVTQTAERELFKHEVYHSVLEVQHVIDEWLVKYNAVRPHRSLGGLTPDAWAKMLDEASCP